MPIVETYGQQRIGTDPIAGTKKTAALTPDALGAQFGDTLARLGAQGLQEVQRRQAEERRRADQLAEVTAERQFNQLDSLMLHSTDRGVLNKGGREPMDLREQYQKEWDEQAGEILKAARTPEQQLVITSLRDRRRAGFVDRYDSHASNQFAQYEQQEITATLESTVQAAADAVSLPDSDRVGAIAEQLAIQRRTVDASAERLKLGPEAKQQLLEKLESQTHVGVVQQLLAKQRDLDAQEYFDEVKQKISPAQRADLEEKLANGSRDALAFKAADDVWQELAPDPTDDKTAITLDRMEAKLRERFKNDPKAFRAAVQYVRERKQGVDDARRERKNNVDSKLWGAVAGNATLTQIRQMPEFQLAEGPEQNRIVEFFRAEVDRNEARVASRDARAERARTRAEREKEEAGWAEVLDITADPAKLRAMSPADILRKLPTLGREHTNRLLNEREKLQANDEKVRDATIDRELFQEVASGAGLDYVYKTPGTMSRTEKATTARLQNAVETEIARMQQDARRQLTREEKRVVMQQIVDQKVMIDRTLLPDYEAIAATVEDGDRGQAYVPLTNVPQGVVKKMANYLRGLPSGTLTFGPPPTDQQVVDRYKDRIQRAYARALLGGSDKEVNGILEGKED
jgi:hypothetical protein